MSPAADRTLGVTDGPAKDRRLPFPYTGSLCPACGRDTIHHTLRTSATLYHRCVSCGALWDRAKQDSPSRRRDD